MSDATYHLGDQGQRKMFVIRDSICEAAVFKTTSAFLKVAESLGLERPVWLFSALVGCKGVSICTNWGFRDLSKYSVDRDPCFLPELEITPGDMPIENILQPWCDTMWQSFGEERSRNYKDGEWRERS